MVRKFLRHSDVRPTIHTYRHLVVEDIRESLGRAFSSIGSRARTAPGLQNREAADGKPVDGLSELRKLRPKSPVRQGFSGAES